MTAVTEQFGLTLRDLPRGQSCRTAAEEAGRVAFGRQPVVSLGIEVASGQCLQAIRNLRIVRDVEGVTDDRRRNRPVLEGREASDAGNRTARIGRIRSGESTGW